MGFLGVYKAIYDYVPQGDGELSISEGDILYVLEKSGEDDWWRAKKKASGDDEDEPVGLIPNNYIEEAPPSQRARALFDYTRQTDEELSFSEDAHLEVFDMSDPDWILVGLDGEYGFAPSNYIDLADDGTAAPSAPARLPALPQRVASPDVEESRVESPRGAPNQAAQLAGILTGRGTSVSGGALPPQLQYTPDASDDEDRPTPSLPARPHSQSFSPQQADSPIPESLGRGVVASPPHTRVSFRDSPRGDDAPSHAPSGFHLYNISEMVSVMGKRKKMPTTFGINLATGKLMIAPEKARDEATQEWTAEKMTHYSIEGKHVFLELVRPSKSVDFHAGAKDTAQEIVSALGELAGASRAEEGLRELYMAGSGQSQKKGVMLYDFMAQGDDEVSVAVDDEVIIIDDSKSDEWWQVRRVMNGKEGVVPSSYVEITEVTSSPPSSSAGVNAGKSTVEKNRLEEQRLAKEAAKDTRAQEIGPGMRLPERGSSLSAGENSNHSGLQRKGRGHLEPAQRSKAKPDPAKIRTWTDRSKSFSVEAQFLALKDGKINLHKLNGVKIAVPVVKMSVEDLEYVEKITGISLDEDKPLSDIKGRKQRQPQASSSSKPAAAVGVTIEQPKKPEYDWFQFFLDCDVAVGVCERYAQVFHRDSMEESILPDVDASVLRNLGLREGDILKVMRHLDQKFGRGKRNASFGGENGESDGESAGGLFSGPGGALRNNTRKGRPAPSVQTNDVVDAKAFSQNPNSASLNALSPTAVTSAPAPLRKDGPGGFDDDAWDVKPSKQQPQSAPSKSPQPSGPQAQQPALTGAMQELSLLSQPLEPTKVQSTVQTPVQQLPQHQPQHQQRAPQPTGASPGFFAALSAQQTGQQQQPILNGSYNQNQQITGQQPQYGQQLQTQQNIARQRPVAPQQLQNNSLMPPPPPRPLSAPQTAQQSAFGPPPLQPQMTGVPNSLLQSSPLAPPGQSLAEITQTRLQQQYNQQQIQQQMAGYAGQQNMIPQQTGFPGQQGVIPQQTGFGQFNSQQQNGFNQQIQPQQTGFNQVQSGPFADPRNQQFSPLQQQTTGFQSQYNPQQQQYPQQTGVNSFLPPALMPQKTAMQPQQTGLNGFGPPPQNFVLPPVPPMPQQITNAPLLPQKTGPPPPVRFGVTGDTKKLMPQATGRRANLASATPQNPFGF